MAFLPYFLPVTLPGETSDEGIVPSSESGTSTDGSLVSINDFCAQAFALLLGQYKDSERLKALICSYLHIVQNIDDAAGSIYYRVLDIDNAFGAQLDLLGRILGEARDGKADFLYRSALRVRILVNRSQGRIEDLIRIVRLFEDLDEQPGALVRVSENGPTSNVTLGTGFGTPQNTLTGSSEFRVSDNPAERVAFPASPLGYTIRAVHTNGNTQDFVVVGRTLAFGLIVLATEDPSLYDFGAGSTTLYRLERRGGATVEVRIAGTPLNLTSEIHKRLRQAKAAAVGLTTIHQEYPSTLGRGFRLSRAADYPEANTTEGLGSAVDGGGGYLLHALR